MKLTSALEELGAWLWPASRALPTEVAARARRLWLDTVGCACAGLQAEEPARWLALQARSDAGAVALPGASVRLSASAATTAFAMGACWDEACEGIAIAHGRPGVPIIAALWAELAAHDLPWDAVWRATVAGYEVATRLGARLRIRPGMHVDGVWGAFGAAVALVHLRGGSWHEAQRAIEACATQLPFSLYRPVREGANVRNLYLGHSAWLGRQAADAVAAGLATPAGAVDDFMALALDGASTGTWPAAGKWLIQESYWKPFAAVRHVHYGAQAVLRLRQEIGDVAAIDAIVLTCYPEALHYCGNRAPSTVLAAQFSLSFGLAAALVFGDLSPLEFRPPRFADPRVRRLEALVETVADAKAFPGSMRGARLAVHCGARSLHIEQGAVTGDASCEPRDDEVAAKFHRYTNGDAALARWAAQLAPHAPARHPQQGDSA